MGMLQKLHDPKLALADKLASQGGINSIVNNEDAHRATLGVYDTTCRVETNFAGMDTNMHTFRGISVEAAAGLALEARVHHTALREDHVKHRKSKKRARPRLALDAHNLRRRGPRELNARAFPCACVVTEADDDEPSIEEREIGFFYTLSSEMEDVFYTVARNHVKASREEAKEALKVHDECVCPRTPCALAAQ